MIKDKLITIKKMLINVKKYIFKVNINALKQKHSLTSKFQLKPVKQVKISCIPKIISFLLSTCQSVAAY